MARVGLIPHCWIPGIPSQFHRKRGSLDDYGARRVNYMTVMMPFLISMKLALRPVTRVAFASSGPCSGP